MNDFIQLYNTAIRSPSSASQVAMQLCQVGVNIVQNTNDLPLKEDILTKLIQLYPKDPSLYYYMGFALKEEFPSKALYFHDMSYKINPNNLENMIDLCDLLIKKKCELDVLEINKNGLFDQFLHDWRFMVLYYQCIKEVSTIESIQYIKLVISHLTKAGCKTDKEKEVMISAHSHLANMYNSLSEHDLSIQAAEKSLKFAKIFKSDVKTSLAMLTTYLFLLNFVEADNDKLREHNDALNELTKQTNTYSFDRPTSTKSSKIKIGYISSDFIGHAVSNFIIPILKNHDRDIFDIHIFPNQAQLHEDIFDLELPYTNISDMKDKEVANLIYEMGIDILIDLNGHTSGNRMGIFALNPAPIQMTYLGYPNTTGLTCFQYRITDSVADPVDSTQYYSEELVRLPKCFLLYKSVRQEKPNIPRKTKDVIVLGSLNKEGKTNKRVLSAWKTILHDCPNTRLLIKLDTAKDVKERTEFYLKHLSVGKERLIIIGKLDDVGYFKLFTMIDIALDTFPYSGTTTTCGSLFNSLPVVTMTKPNCHAHNVSASILTNAGLSELVTKSESEYIELVKDLVANPKRVDEYKRTTHRKFVESMNPAAFMPDYESLLKNVYSKHSIGLPISVSDHSVFLSIEETV
jgi:protein O-GlcNAc transferase